MGKKEHVVPRGFDWADMAEGNERATSTHGTQAAAIERGKRFGWVEMNTKADANAFDGQDLHGRALKVDEAKPRAIRERRRKQRHNQHVIPFDNGWAIREEGKTIPKKICQTQKDAIGAARVIAIRDRSSVVIHSRDGRIRDRESYGTDPYPPKEMRTVLLPVTDTVTDPKKIRDAVNEVIQESRKTS